MGCGPLLRRQTACTDVTANLRSKRPAFHTPSVAFGDTFPAPRRRGRPAAACRVDDLCERRKVQAQIGRKAPYAKPLKGFGDAGVLEIVDDFDGDTFRARVHGAIRQGGLWAARLPEEIEARRRHAEGRAGPDRPTAQTSERG